MTAFLRTAAVCLAGLLCSPLAGADRVALVIGIDKYDNLPRQAQLKVAVSDAKKMASALESLEPAFDVTLLTNVEQREAMDTLFEFRDQARDAECALVYFAGHGIEYHGENFLITRDTAVGKESSDIARTKRRLGTLAVSLQVLVDELDATNAQVKIVILDACRDNPLEVADTGGTRSVLGSRGGLAVVTPPSGTLVAYSADAGQQANDGLFTEQLIRQMKQPGLTLPDVFAVTREQVKAESKKLVQAERGVYHEPAEYTKLNLAGNRFAFMRGVPAEVKVSEEQARKMAELEEQVAAMKKIIESLEQAGTENEALREQLSKMESALDKEKTSKPEAPKTMAVTQPEQKPAFPTTRGMQGSKAGETRTFGGIEFVWCPPTGEEGFLMGSPVDEEERGDDETQHRVVLPKGFWMAKTECTQGQWGGAMSSNPSNLKGSKNLPVEKVSWDDVQEWLAKMNEAHPLTEGWEWALPTEAQWEYACRAGTDTAFAFGNSLGSSEANFNGNYPYGGAEKGKGLKKTVEVGSYEANEWGLFDMHGNVFEWCADWYGENYYADGQRDPTGAASGSYRVNRGGSWIGDGDYCRSAYRSKFYPAYRTSHLGFRPVVSFVGGESIKVESDKPMTITQPEQKPVFSATRGMEGSKAGETRSFGGIEFVWCPPTEEGGFLMGSPVDEEYRGDDETQHRVILTKGFWMAKTECTQGQWESAMGSNPSEFTGSKNLPEEQVSWDDVQEWLAKMNEKHPLPEGWKWALPTETQWEYACRAGTEGAYAGDLEEIAWYVDNSGFKSHEVGQRKANAWGLQDMHGSVYEWCADWYGDYATGVVTDPTGAASGSYRVIRGGSWNDLGYFCRSAHRSRSLSGNRNLDFGFRPAVSSTQ